MAILSRCRMVRLPQAGTGERDRADFLASPRWRVSRGLSPRRGRIEALKGKQGHGKPCDLSQGGVRRGDWLARNSIALGQAGIAGLTDIRMLHNLRGKLQENQNDQGCRVGFPEVLRRMARPGARVSRVHCRVRQNICGASLRIALRGDVVVIQADASRRLRRGSVRWSACETEAASRCGSTWKRCSRPTDFWSNRSTHAKGPPVTGPSRLRLRKSIRPKPATACRPVARASRTSLPSVRRWPPRVPPSA